LCIDIANGHAERTRAADRLKAAQFVLAIAGVKAAEQDERQVDEAKSAPIIVSVQVGGVPAPEPVDVTDGQSRVME